MICLNLLIPEPYVTKKLLCFVCITWQSLITRRQQLIHKLENIREIFFTNTSNEFQVVHVYSSTQFTMLGKLMKWLLGSP